jgi:hypothetical protein
MGEPADVVAYLDDRATPQADTLGLARLDRLVDEAMLRLHFEERELDQPPSTTGTPLSTRCAGDITGSRPTPAGATSPSNPAPGSGPNPTACASTPTTAALGT